MEAIIRCDFCIDVEALQEPVSHICSVTDGYLWLELCFGEVHLVDQFWRCSLSGAPYYVPYYRLIFIHHAPMT